MMYRLSVLLVVLLFFGGCYYDVEEVIYPNQVCETEDVSYSQIVVPILEVHCFLCHNQGSNLGNVTLEGYDNLINYVQNGRLLGAIRHESGFSPMPKGNPKLSDCQIDKIASWIDSGSPNN